MFLVMRNELFFLFIYSLIFGNVSGYLNEKKLKAMNNVKMSEKQIEKFKQMHYGWYMQAVSSVLGTVGKQIYMKMKKPERRAFVACLDSIEKEYDVKAGANCLVKAFDGKLHEDFGNLSLDPKLDFIETQDQIPMSKLNIKKVKKQKRKKRIIQKMAKLRVKKFIDGIQRKKMKKAKFRKLMKRYHASQYQMTPKMIAKMRKINNLRRVKRNVLSLYSNKEAEDEARRIESLDRGIFRPKNRDKMPSLLDTKKSPVKALTVAIREAVAQNSTKKLENSFSSLQKLQDAVYGAREKNKFKNRMLDMVIGKNHPLRRPKSFTDRMRDITPDGLVDENVYGLVDSVSKHTKEVNSNFLSPRFLPIMPGKYDSKIRDLSPDMFPLYKDDSDNSILPLPTVLDKSGLNVKDRDTLLELIMDVSGVNSVVDETMELVNGLHKSGLDGDLLDITNLIDSAYKSVKDSLTNPQKLDMVNKMFTFMNMDQMKTFYGEKGVYNTSLADLPFDMNEVAQLTPEQQDESVKMTIREIAKGNGAQGKGKGSRTKRQTITLLNGLYKVVFLAPTVFAPGHFTITTNTLSVLGPLVLSPQLFCPSVLSPLLMSLPVISPQVGNPLIFSPYVVGPNVLSAAVFNAYVFSPYVLSPNVVNPYVLSPLILSPFVLCPDAVSPTILSGVILSPSVLSPSIFTDSALAVNVLSPTFLS